MAARDWLGVTASVPVLGFIGALGDRRKGLDTLYDAWQRFPAGSLLVVAGAGRELGFWQEKARSDGLTERIRFLGFCRGDPSTAMGLRCGGGAEPLRALFAGGPRGACQRYTLFSLPVGGPVGSSTRGSWGSCWLVIRRV